MSEEFVVGRLGAPDRPCHLELQRVLTACPQNVSRQHLAFRYATGHYYVRNLSQNGSVHISRSHPHGRILPDNAWTMLLDSDVLVLSWNREPHTCRSCIEVEIELANTAEDDKTETEELSSLVPQGTPLSLRAEMVRGIIGRFAERRHYHLAGPCGIGKTQLLAGLGNPRVSRLSPQAAGFAFCYVDLQTLETLDTPAFYQSPHSECPGPVSRYDSHGI